MSGAVPSVLARIADDVVRRLDERKGQRSEADLRALLPTARRAHDFAHALRFAPRIIAEIKPKSPSEGELAPGVNPVDVAAQYLESGAAALSVLTEEDHFGGSLRNLARVRDKFPQARLLMKDFVVDEYQLLEAAAYGADAVLLIVALLGEKRAGELLAASRRLGLSALVEVHDEAEMRAASAIGADLIGVNNRDLKTLKISLEVSRRLVTLAPQSATLVSESGFSKAEEITELQSLGYSGFLIGTSFMRSPRPGDALGALVRDLKKMKAAP